MPGAVKGVVNNAGMGGKVAYLRSYTGMDEKQNIFEPALLVTSMTAFHIRDVRLCGCNREI